jgi:hypothetical protein
MVTQITPITSPPFTATIPNVGHGQATADNNLLPTLWFRDRAECAFEAPQPHDIDFLYHEMFLNRLDKIQGWYYLCSPDNVLGPPLPLYRTRYLAGRPLNLRRTEDLNLHLLYSLDALFLKPLPPWLLSSDFWDRHLIPTRQDPIEENRRKAVVASAFGFLFSYCTLLCYPDDFRIAKENGLLPESITWELWRQIAEQVLQNYRKERVHSRFWYGRLRLSIVQSAYQLKTTAFMSRYSEEGDDYWMSPSLGRNFTALAAVLGFIVIALTVMQVGLATQKLQASPAFQRASWGFTVFSLLAPLILIILILVSPIILTLLMLISIRIWRPRRMRRLGFT